MPDTPKTIALADIDDSGRLRPVEPAHAALIAASIEQSSLLTPVSVRAVAAAALPWRLVAGAHRLAALRLLGRTELEIGRDVTIVVSDDLNARLAEIDENLARHELNALDRALSLAERRHVYEEIHVVHGHGGDRKTALINNENIKRQTLPFDISPRFDVDVAERVGLSERSVRLALRIASRLTPEQAAALRGKKIERNQNELLALTNLEAPQRALAAAAIGRGEARTVAQARVAIGIDVAVISNDQTRLWALLLDCWRRAGPLVRAQFLDHVSADPEQSARARKTARDTLAAAAARQPWAAPEIQAGAEMAMRTEPRGRGGAAKAAAKSRQGS